MAEGRFNKINKNHRNAKIMALHRPQKRHLFTVCRLKRGRSSLCLTSAGNVRVGKLKSLATVYMHMSVNNDKNVSMDLGVKNKF